MDSMRLMDKRDPKKEELKRVLKIPKLKLLHILVLMEQEIIKVTLQSLKLKKIRSMESHSPKRKYSRNNNNFSKKIKNKKNKNTNSLF